MPIRLASLNESTMRHERAKAKLELMDAEVEAFFNSDAHTLTPKASRDGDSYDARWFASVRQEPSVWWPVELDYIAYGFGGRTFPIHESRKRYFATYTDGSPRPGTGPDLLASVHEKIAGAVEAEQPYNVSPANPKRDPLWLLDQLRNLDAHANLNVVTAVVYGLRYSMIEGELTDVRFRKMAPGPLHNGAQVARLTGKIVRPAPPDVTVRLHATLSIAFDDSGPVSKELVAPVLNSIFNRVGRVADNLRNVWREIS